jgi:hypothetical protein
LLPCAPQGRHHDDINRFAINEYRLAQRPFAGEFVRQIDTGRANRL